MSLSHEIKFLFSGLALVSVLVVAPASAAGLNPGEVKQLEALEMKYFEHTYAKEQPEPRIERVEEMVFGEAKKGDDETRLAALMSAGPPKDLDDDGSSGSSNGGGSGSSASGGGSADSGSNDSSDAEDTAGDTAEYPRVDAMEQVMLGKVFKGERIEHRLDQLELKAFGKTTTNADLSSRTDTLEDFVQNKYHKSVAALTDPRAEYHYDSPVANSSGNVRAPAYTGSPYGGHQQGSGAYGYGGGQGYGAAAGGQNYGAPQGSPYGQAYSAPAPAPAYGGGYASAPYAPPHGGTAGGAASGAQGSPPGATETQQLDWLEMNVFGQITRNAPLVDRVRQLEACVFPSEAPDPRSSIPEQIGMLVNAVELMHKSPTAQQPAGGAQPAGANSAAGSNFPSWPPQDGVQSGYADTNAVDSGSQYQQGNQMQQGASAQGNQWPSSSQFPQFPDDGSGGGAQDPSQQGSSQQQAQQGQQQHGHPFLKSLAHSLMTAGTMAAGMAAGTAMSYGMGSMMGRSGMGMGGMGGMGYNNSGYGSGYGNRRY